MHKHQKGPLRSKYAAEGNESTYEKEIRAQNFSELKRGNFSLHIILHTWKPTCCYHE